MSLHYGKVPRIAITALALGLFAFPPSGHAYASEVDLDALLQRVRAYDARYSRPIQPPVSTIRFQRFTPTTPAVPAVPQLRTITLPSAVPGSSLNPIYMAPAGYVPSRLPSVPTITVPSQPMGSQYNPVHFRVDAYNSSGLPTIPQITVPTAPLGSRYNPIYVR